MRNFEQRRKEDTSGSLKSLLALQSEKVNEILKQEYNLDNFLNADATINTEGYTGLHDESARQEHMNFVRERELDFSSARNPNVQAFYKEEYGAKNEDEILTKWRENRSREMNSKMEMAVTALLTEKLGKDFLVVRTTDYDDYGNGVDNLIFDRTTGEVVGAFDEVHEGGKGQRTQEKEKKIKKIAERGGTKISYGLKFVDGKMVRASLEGVPVFYLGLEKSELLDLMQGLADKNEEKTGKIFRKLIDSLFSQQAELEKSAKSKILINRLASFKKTLVSFGNVLEGKAA